MNAAQRIRLIRIIEKIEKNPEFSNKLGVKNTSGFISDSNHMRELHKEAIHILDTNMMVRNIMM